LKLNEKQQQRINSKESIIFRIQSPSHNTLISTSTNDSIKQRSNTSDLRRMTGKHQRTSRHPIKLRPIMTISKVNLTLTRTNPNTLCMLNGRCTAKNENIFLAKSKVKMAEKNKKPCLILIKLLNIDLYILYVILEFVRQRDSTHLFDHPFLFLISLNNIIIYNILKYLKKLSFR
ncbi:MAG: hypothetical protein Q8T08_03730, partial [Ignavibacteria bacterium]|nr:hypothetical protein [Ignavibacteria bacterium]